MREHLVFALTATVAAMGDVAGHERRGTETWPGRAAILGLLGAAMGVRHGGDFSALDRLGLAVSVFDAGRPLRDYHTVETVPSAATRRLKRPPHSRAEALAVAGRNATNTTVTTRDYRVGVAYGVALWGGPLAEIAEALTRPAFALYLGRRACPLSAPIAPLPPVAAESPVQALAHLRLPPWITARTARTLYVDATGGEARVEERRDVPLDRSRRHFGPRRVAALSVEIEAASPA